LILATALAHLAPQFARSAGVGNAALKQWGGVFGEALGILQVLNLLACCMLSFLLAATWSGASEKCQDVACVIITLLLLGAIL